jgi:hypothetical protein
MLTQTPAGVLLRLSLKDVPPGVVHTIELRQIPRLLHPEK